MKLPKRKNRLCLFVVICLLILILVGILYFWIHIPFILALSCFLCGLAAWKSLFDLRVYLDIYQNGNTVVGVFKSYTAPVFIHALFGQAESGGRLNLFARIIPIVQFHYGADIFELQIWGFFQKPPANAGDNVNLIYYEEYPSKVVLKEEPYLKKYAQKTLQLCVLYLLLIVLQLVVFTIMI